ncbi:MAG: ABC transporter ATP-binding protein [Actinomycetota bacterium]
MAEGDSGEAAGSQVDGPVLRMVGVVQEYRDGGRVIRALDGIDLTVAAGEMVAVTGRSGSGKSTLLNLAGGLEEPTAGRIWVDGEAVDAMTRTGRAELRRRRVGFVFQSLNLVPSLTASENVALPLEFDRVGPKPARTAARQALERIGASELADRFPDQLSGGERQRVAIARAVVGRRRLVLADEPTGALDEMTGRQVLRLLADLADGGAAVVLVTHDVELAAAADRVIRLRDGAVDQITERPSAPASVAELLR